VGIHAALVHAVSDVIVLAWDMPFVPVALLEALRDRLRAGALAVVPLTTEGPEAVCAAYSADALPHVERLLHAGVLKLSDLLDALPRVDRLTPPDIARFGAANVIFFNVNSPADLTRAEEIADAL
jgi:molybdopterin-guanine dinucleotide biosynthesis protein A